MGGEFARLMMEQAENEQDGDWPRGGTDYFALPWVAVFARKQGRIAAGCCRVGRLISNRPVTSCGFAMPVAEQPPPPIFKPESHYED